MDRASGHSRGFGFVTYADRAGFDACFALMGTHQIDGTVFFFFLNFVAIFGHAYARAHTHQLLLRNRKHIRFVLSYCHHHCSLHTDYVSMCITRPHLWLLTCALSKCVCVCYRQVRRPEACATAWHGTSALDAALSR